MPENDPQPNKLKLRKNYYEPTAEDQSARPPYQGDTSTNGESQRESFSLKQKSSRTRQHIFVLLGWLFFIGLGAALLCIRFFSALPGIAPETIKFYGMIAVGAVYAVSILLALKDNMFDGLLAIVVPFYPFYYLFLSCGSIFLRALGAALLLAFGFDCLLLFQKIALQLYDKVSFWIQNV